MAVLLIKRIEKFRPQPGNWFRITYKSLSDVMVADKAITEGEILHRTLNNDEDFDWLMKFTPRAPVECESSTIKRLAKTGR